MKLIKGKNLTPSQIAEVKSAFVYRWTIQNLSQAKSIYDRLGFSYPRIQPVDDSQWLKEYAFYFRKDGTLSSKPNYCVPAYFTE